jgi:hypothetical protein
MKVVAIWHGRSWRIKGLQRGQTMPDDCDGLTRKREAAPVGFSRRAQNPPPSGGGG